MKLPFGVAQCGKAFWHHDHPEPEYGTAHETDRLELVYFVDPFSENAREVVCGGLRTPLFLVVNIPFLSSVISLAAGSCFVSQICLYSVGTGSNGGWGTI